MRNFKNNILRIKRIKKRVRLFRYYKVENLYKTNSKIMISELNKDLFLLKLNIKIINKRDISRIYLII